MSKAGGSKRDDAELAAPPPPPPPTTKTTATAAATAAAAAEKAAAAEATTDYFEFKPSSSSSMTSALAAEAGPSASNIDVSVPAVVARARPPVLTAARYALVKNRVYLYDDRELREVTWREPLADSRRPDCALVVPFCQQTGLFLSGYRIENQPYLRLECRWHGGDQELGPMRCVSNNHQFMVDCERAILQMTTKSGRLQVRDTGHTVPDHVDTVHNVSTDAAGRLLVYGSSGGANTLTFATGGPELTFDTPEKIASALDIVHLPGTQVVYLIWSGHIEEMPLDPSQSMPTTGTKTIFVPKNCRVGQILHPFCDKRGIVVLVQDIWSKRQSILRCRGEEQWEIALPLDGIELGLS